MEVAEVIHAAQYPHACRQGFWHTGQRAGAPGEAIEPLTEGGVQTLDVGRVDHSTTLTAREQGLDLRNTALYHPPLNLPNILVCRLITCTIATSGQE